MADPQSKKGGHERKIWKGSRGQTIGKKAVASNYI
jgi:hypothetical protein